MMFLRFSLLPTNGSAFHLSSTASLFFYHLSLPAQQSARICCVVIRPVYSPLPTHRCRCWPLSAVFTQSLLPFPNTPHSHSRSTCFVVFASFFLLKLCSSRNSCNSILRRSRFPVWRILLAQGHRHQGSQCSLPPVVARFPKHTPRFLVSQQHRPFLLILSTRARTLPDIHFHKWAQSNDDNDDLMTCNGKVCPRAT